MRTVSTTPQSCGYSPAMMQQMSMPMVPAAPLMPGSYMQPGGMLMRPMAPSFRGSAPKVPRWNISKKALEVLEEIFRLEKFPSAEMRRRLAADFGVAPRQVQFWFQNRRQRERKARADPGAAENELSEAPADSIDEKTTFESLPPNGEMAESGGQESGAHGDIDNDEQPEVITEIIDGQGVTSSHETKRDDVLMRLRQQHLASSTSWSSVSGGGCSSTEADAGSVAHLLQASAVGCANPPSMEGVLANAGQGQVTDTSCVTQSEQAALSTKAVYDEAQSSGAAPSSAPILHSNTPTLFTQTSPVVPVIAAASIAQTPAVPGAPPAVAVTMPAADLSAAVTLAPAA